MAVCLEHDDQRLGCPKCGDDEVNWDDVWVGTDAMNARYGL
jgi:hypothetical protein